MSEPRKYFVPPPTEWGWGSVVAVAGLVIVMVVIFFTGKSPQQTLTGESPHKQLVPHASGMRGSSEYARLSEQRGITGGRLHRVVSPRAMLHFSTHRYPNSKAASLGSCHEVSSGLSWIRFA